MDSALTRPAKPHQSRMHMAELFDPVIEHQKITLISYIVPGHNCDAKSRPAIMIRGSFPDTESAQRAAKAFKNQSLNTYAVETGKIIPACPTVDEMDGVPAIYSDSELNEIMGGINKRNEEANQAFEEHCSASRDRKTETPETLMKSIDSVIKEIKEKEAHLDLLRSELNRVINHE
jgi:hypothetical protein